MCETGATSSLAERPKNDVTSFRGLVHGKILWVMHWQSADGDAESRRGIAFIQSLLSVM